MTYGARPFGLRDVKVTSTAGTQADLPAARLLTLTARLKSGELLGDDSIVSVYSALEGFEWKLEAGGIDLSVYAILTGATQYTSGSTPNRIRSLTLTAGACWPWFKIYGKAIGDDCTSDIHAKIFKAKVTKLEGSLQEGEFYVTACEGIAVDDGSTGIIQFIQHETAASLPAS